MENYRAYLPELKTIPLFNGIEEEDLIALLEAMQPAIVRKKTGVETPSRIPEGYFNICLKNYLNGTIDERENKYTMPKIGQPGMMMGEIPALSEAFKNRPPMPPKPGTPPIHPPRNMDEDCLEMSGEMMVKFYSDKIYPAQSKMLRNMLGILAQKVTDIRRANKEQVDGLNKQIEELSAQTK